MNDPVNISALLSGAILGVVTMTLATLLVLFVHARQRKSSQGGGRVPLASDTARQGASAPNFVSEIEEITKRIDAAAADGDNGALAGLYLDLARRHTNAGDDISRLSALRSAATCGAQHGPHACHAEARLELAEAAYRAGDLTTACEQWQMARMALLKDGQTEHHASVEKRMRENGCPTDWVLTGF